MKIDNIVNKEKSPDKASVAERSASIEELKKSQKFYELNDLSSVTNINNNLLQEQESIFNYLPPTTSKLKKLLLHNDSESGHLNNDIHANSGFLTNSLANSNSATIKHSIAKATGELVAVNNRKNGNNVVKKSARNVNKQRLFLCSECNERFPKLQLFNHIKSVHNKFTCLYCYGFFVDVGALEKHLVRKHKVQNTNFFDELSLQSFLAPKTAEVEAGRSVEAVCCKCATIFNYTDDKFYSHSCSVGEKTTEVPANKAHQTFHKNHFENPTHPSLNQLPALINSHPALLNQLPPVQNSIPPLANSASDELPVEPAKESSHNSIPATQQWYSPNVKSPTREELSLSANESSSQILPQQNNDWHPEPPHQPTEEKLVVPKLTLKIPKAFQHQQFDNVESEEDSGDEESSSEEDNDKSQDLSKSNHRGDYSSSLSDSDNEVEPQAQEETPKKPENMPSLKLKIKNLASNNPESVLENFDFSNESLNRISETQNDVDLSECPMDIEEANDTSKINPEPEEELPKLIIVDGVIVTPANEDVLTLDISLDEPLDKVPIVKLMKICLKASFPFCLYCNHARKIVVNGRALATHFISHHRFHAMVDSITAEELSPDTLVSKFESSIDELKSCFFNLETFDNQDQEKKEGHVTISHDKLYECFQCRFQTPIHKELYLHNRKMHQKSLINCLMCKMAFYSYSELLCHICPGVVNKQMFLDYKFYCCLCNLDNIPSAFRLMVHLRKKHYACDVCLEKCSDQSKLSSHVWKHKLNHLCYRCNVCYRNKADIMKHLFWKHGTEGVECKKCLQKKWPHVYHFCIPPAAFTCTHCEMSFSRAMSLNVHMRLHEDGAKYACTEIGCEKKFVSRKLLLRHLDRHQVESAAAEGEKAGQERAEGTVMIPQDIPEGNCTRTMAVVFKRMPRKPPVRKFENEMKPEVKPETEEIKSEKEAKSLPDLPETNLNLSESSDSDSSSSDEEGVGERTIEAMAVLLEAQIENQLEADDEPADETRKQVPTLGELAKVSSLTDSEDDDETESKGVVKKVEKMDETADTPSADEKKVVDVKQETKTKEEPAAVKEEKEVEDRLPENPIIHVCQSDHDYAILFGPPPGSISDDLEGMIISAKALKEQRKIEKAKAKAAKANRVKKPSDPNNDFSSSDSSSGSSSSSSGSSSGSSSSSSGSSSDSSSSEGSANGVPKPRNKKFSKKRSKKEKKPKADAEEPEVPRDPDDIIYESDLLTDETDTDEDFYDEHPLKLDSQMAEKRKQLLKGGVIDGIVENSRPSTPSLPPDEKIEKRMKKKRKKEHRKSSSPTKRSYDSGAIVNPGDASMTYVNSSIFSIAPETPFMNKKSFGYHQTSTPISAAPRIELHQANQIRQLLQSTQQQPVLPILKEQHFYHSQASNMSMTDYVNISHVPSIGSSATSSRKNSDSEQANLKRSQRKRIPNKFYGYTSDDESMAAQLALNPNDPFKPIPPPQFTWRKEDLPAKSKSPCGTPRIAPLKLSLAGDQLQQQLHSFAQEQQRQTSSPQVYDFNFDASPTPERHQVPVHVPHNNINANVMTHANQPSDSDSSDDQLHISEPRRRKRKLPNQANSMYAFHTLETPPTVSQPPIPRLKLTIGSNNKIRRRNINPLKVSAAKKRKLNPAPKKNMSQVETPPARGQFNPYAKQYDLQPPTRLLQSPSFDQVGGQEASSSRQMVVQDRLDKQQKLEEAILNTQQYFQRFNHTQVNAELLQETADDDGRLYCYCRRPYNEVHGMIGCDGSSCQIEWFHFECVGILVPPKGNWYCPECQKTQPAGF